MKFIIFLLLFPLLSLAEGGWQDISKTDLINKIIDYYPNFYNIKPGQVITNKQITTKDYNLGCREIYDTTKTVLLGPTHPSLSLFICNFSATSSP